MEIRAIGGFGRLENLGVGGVEANLLALENVNFLEPPRVSGDWKIESSRNSGRRRPEDGIRIRKKKKWEE